MTDSLPGNRTFRANLYAALRVRNLLRGAALVVAILLLWHIGVALRQPLGQMAAGARPAAVDSGPESPQRRMDYSPAAVDSAEQELSARHPITLAATPRQMKGANPASLARLENAERDETIDVLAQRLNGPLETSRIAAIEAIGDSGEAAAVALLAPLLDDDAPGVRLAAVDALAAIGDPQSWIYLEPRLFDRHTRVRLRAIDALVEIANPDAVYALAALLSDGDLAVRRSAIAALDDLDGPLAREYLLPMRNDPDPSIRASVEAMRIEWSVADPK